jgi:decaprenylphospho-beta-D-ribofuranose 2-oxidase
MARSSVSSPFPSRQRLHSYGGDFVEATVYAPRSVDDLRRVLRTARDRQWRVTFRGGGCAFDTQSLNRDVVVSLAALDRIEVDARNATVTAEAGATWGEVVAATVPHGLVPYSLVTTRSATVAGTAASDCLSRFSPYCGKEGSHILSFELLTVDGRLLRCTREQNADVFFAAIGGFGYLGAITQVTYRLWPLGYIPAVETEVTPYRSRRDLLTALVPAAGSSEPRRMEGLYGAWFHQRALLFRSRYVEQGRRRRRPLRLLHEPRSWLRAGIDLMLRWQWFCRLGSWLTFNLIRRPRTFVDRYEDYAFFMDGNAHAKAIGRAFGAQMRTLQQTFVVPADVETAARFIEDLSGSLRVAKIVPTLFDCLFIPRDEDFLLSSSAGLDGFAVSIAFDTSDADVLARARAILVEASARLRAIGGRVHLVKSVCADADDLRSMYGTRLDAFFRLKQELDPTGVLRNEFLERTFPAYCASPASVRSAR